MLCHQKPKLNKKIIIPIALILSHPEGLNKPNLYTLTPSPRATPPLPLTTMKRCDGPCGIKMDKSGYSITTWSRGANRRRMCRKPMTNVLLLLHLMSVVKVFTATP